MRRMQRAQRSVFAFRLSRTSITTLLASQERFSHRRRNRCSKMLSAEGTTAICIEAGEAKAAMDAMPTDRNDARGTSQIIHTGWSASEKPKRVSHS